MKNYCLFFSIVLLSFSCQNSKKPIIQETVKQRVVSIGIKQDSSYTYGFRIDYDNTKVIRTVFVDDRNGAEIRQHPQNESTILGTYEYGSKLDVIEENGDWFGIRVRYTRRLEEEGRIIERTAWEKVFVNKSSVSFSQAIKLTEQDLYLTNYYIEYGNSSVEANDSILKSVLSIELIEKTIFENAKSSKISFVANDTIISKRNGKFQIYCNDTIKELIDNPNAEESYAEYKFVGEIDFLNCYVFSGSYWESGDYILIDRSFCNEKKVIIDYPHISPDRKYLISIYSNPYEGTADFQIFLIWDNYVQDRYYIKFSNWMPAIEKEEVFWSSDGFLYVPALHSQSFWDKSGSLNTDFQYLKIKIH